ncbi:Phage tail-collar fibre protein [Fulvimarina manganoxydans]|uniref:Phage tail-collar fibre protein n=1 Tax=Fulvimarina manganoxydans TaxID=937218 RepID=A0A1W2CWK0_9HYPH|nr:Phage tail-collar fibre protein [Fulvimarina manganoxydans]
MPVTAGDYWVTEAAILDGDGDCVAITKIPVFQKIASSSGSYDDLVLEFVIGVGRNATVNVTLDPSAVLATRAYVSAQLEGLGSSIFYHGLL